MKKIASIILPSLIILTFILVDSTNPYSKNIIVGLYLLFPVIFAVQGFVCSSLKRDFIIGIALSSLAVIIPTSIFYNMGSCVPFVVIYISIAFIIYFIKLKLFNNRNSSSDL